MRAPRLKRAMHPSTVIVVQARANSSRLPRKMLLPFFEGRGVYELILERLIAEFGKEPVIVATTKQPVDNEIVRIAAGLGVRVYRGSEQDVLLRMVEAAAECEAAHVVRVCADNPFILPNYIRPLIDAIQTGQWDYVSYVAPDGTPAIRTHTGLFAEAVTVSALKSVVTATDDPLFREHVTNFLYTHADRYRIHWLDFPEPVRARQDIRLTMDDADDFDTLKSLYARVRDTSSLEHLVNVIDSTHGMLDGMKTRIAAYTK